MTKPPERILYNSSGKDEVILLAIMISIFIFLTVCLAWIVKPDIREFERQEHVRLEQVTTNTINAYIGAIVTRRNAPLTPVEQDHLKEIHRSIGPRTRDCSIISSWGDGQLSRRICIEAVTLVLFTHIDRVLGVK